MSQTLEKLRSAECEIRTLKSFLTSKTAMIEKRKKELREAKTMVSELMEKDQRRAVILADVLEKTARQYQQGVDPRGTVLGKPSLLETVRTPLDIRSIFTSLLYTVTISILKLPLIDFVVPLL